MAAFLSRLADNAVLQQGGNAFGAAAVLGTTDTQAVEIVVHGERAFRAWHVPQGASTGPGVNMLGGHSTNVISRTCSGLQCLTGVPVRGGTIAGGGSSSGWGENRVTDSWGTVGGGTGNTAGNENADSDDAHHAVVAGGFGNTASDTYAAVGGGVSNVASGNFATVPGGASNRAEGTGSFAAGSLARASASGCFVWSDGNHANQYLTCSTQNAFLARAGGGFNLRTNAAFTAGCAIAAGGGTWNCSSSRDLKDDFEAIDPRAILDSVVSLPILSWRYRDEVGRARHLGPTAEDFREAFGLGDSSKDIGLVDGQGVALAAIQGLNAKVEEQARLIATMRETIEALEQRLAQLSKP
jgi:hypothetical protein